MQTNTVTDGPRRVLVVVCDKGEDPVDAVSRAVRSAGIHAAQVTGIGALRSARLGYFDRDERNYQQIPVDEQVEVLAMVGDIAAKYGEPVLHAHVVLGRRDGSTVGGHLMSGEVWPTLEVIVTEVAPALAKKVDPDTGLALISL